MDRSLQERFLFRSVLPEETKQAIVIEHICFPPNEACSAKALTARIANVSPLFLVAVDRETGKLAGFLNGISTKETQFRDEFFTDVSLYDPSGDHVMLLGLDVLPSYRKNGLGRKLVEEYARREKSNGRTHLVLTCLARLVGMYQKFGFTDDGIANSTWGGEEWHQMTLEI